MLRHAAALVGLEALAYAVVLPHLPLVVGEGRPWWAVGVLFAGYSVAQLAALGPIGRLAERFAVRSVITACLLGTAVGLVMTALSTDYWVLLAARVIDGASAGTLVVVTAVTLSWFPRRRWTAVLGGLGAVRGLAALAGIVATAMVGVVLADPERGLSLTAWVGTGLVLAAIGYVRKLRPADVGWSVGVPSRSIGRPARSALFVHIAAQGAAAGLVLLAPAVGSTVASLQVGFATPAAAIVGLAVGQTVVARRMEGRPSLRIGAWALLAVGTVAATRGGSVLAGFVLTGIAIGSWVPRAQAALIEWRVMVGDSDVAANALAGRAAIVGQIAGPAVSYVGLTLSTTLAAALVAALGVGGSRARYPVRTR